MMINISAVTILTFLWMIKVRWTERSFWRVLTSRAYRFSSSALSFWATPNVIIVIQVYLNAYPHFLGIESFPYSPRNSIVNGFRTHLYLLKNAAQVLFIFFASRQSLFPSAYISGESVLNLNLYHLVFLTTPRRRSVLFLGLDWTINVTRKPRYLNILLKQNLTPQMGTIDLIVNLLESGGLASVSDSYRSCIQPCSFSHVYTQWSCFFYIG